MKINKSEAEAYANAAFAKVIKAPWPKYKRALADAYLKGAEEAISSQWIELTPDSAPPLNTDILCLCDPGDVAVLQMVYTEIKPGARQLTWLPFVKCKITHWMMIPELPKTEEI